MPTFSESSNNQVHSTHACGETRTRIACIGDSITELSGYPNYLKQARGNSYEVGNFGACGTTVALDSENAYIHSRAYALAKDFQPTHAVVMLGTNDANQDFSRNRFLADYMALLNALTHLPSKPKVWVVKPPHVFEETWLSGHILSTKVIPSVDEAAQQTCLPLIDVYSATDKADLFFDGVHPNDEGAKIIADMIYQAVIKTENGLK
jgi:acyl-CoA thioesterase I